MQTSVALPQSSPKFNLDRLGVVASALCAVHCAVTPILLIALPAFGKTWSHPASHWLMALVVVPIAVLMMTAGYRKHRRRWIIATGVAGIAFVMIGAAIPYLKSAGESGDSGAEIAAASVETDGDSCAVDECCPSLVADDEGNFQLHVPAASIVTMLGGVALIVTHVGNLCCCSACRSPKGRTPTA